MASSSDGSKLVAAEGYIYTSSNYGVTWVQQTNTASYNWSSVASSSDGSKLVATAMDDYGCNIYTSTNYGVTWVQQTNAGIRSWSSVASSSDGSKVLAAGADETGRGRLYTRPNYITQWSTVYVYGDAYANIELVYAGGGLWVPCSYSGTFTIQ